MNKFYCVHIGLGRRHVVVGRVNAREKENQKNNNKQKNEEIIINPIRFDCITFSCVPFVVIGFGVSLFAKCVPFCLQQARARATRLTVDISVLVA